MRILVIGSNGQLGREVCVRGEDQGLDIVPLDLPDIDITNPLAVKELISRSGVSLVVNAAAYTAVDRAESETEIALAVNRDGPAHMAAACDEAGIPLVHISTDYVFDGSKVKPYSETDAVSPLGVYGKSKAAGEKEIRERLEEHVIVRTAWLYGVHGANFVKTMLRLGKEEETLSVVADQFGCPTYAADLADAILTIAGYIREGSSLIRGTYHYCGRGATTWCDFAGAIFEIASRYESFRVKEVRPITTSEYYTPAKRPANSVLDCSLIAGTFGITPRPWQESLADMLKRLLGAHKPGELEEERQIGQDKGT